MRDGDYIIYDPCGELLKAVKLIEDTREEDNDGGRTGVHAGRDAGRD